MVEVGFFFLNEAGHLAHQGQATPIVRSPFS